MQVKVNQKLTRINRRCVILMSLGYCTNLKIAMLEEIDIKATQRRMANLKNKLTFNSDRPWRTLIAINARDILWQDSQLKDCPFLCQNKWEETQFEEEPRTQS